MENSNGAGGLDIVIMKKINGELKGTYSAHVGDNKFLVSHVANMYLKEGDSVADVTYGKGTFWKDIDQSKYNLYFSDILTCDNAKYDFRDLPYPDNKFDVVVLDPPYCHNPGRMIVEANYKNSETTRGMYHEDIINLYKEGMIEAIRITKPNGYVWVKCQDEVETSFQRWSHIELYNIATKLGLFAKDLFVLVQKNYPFIQHKIQKHARKNHSYLWIFKKPLEKELKALKRHNIL